LIFRSELKYILATRDASDLKMALLHQGLFSRDPNANQTDGYWNYSIYLDTLDHYFYRDKIEGAGNRAKPRLRSHLDTPETEGKTWYAELKGKVNSGVSKARALLNTAERDCILSGVGANANLFNDLNTDDETSLNALNYCYNMFHILPTVSILYHRSALVFTHDNRLRVTFDSHISSSLNCSVIPCQKTRHFLLPENQILIELKFNNVLPKYILDTFYEFDMKQVTHSKYSNGLDFCHNIQPQF